MQLTVRQCNQNVKLGLREWQEIYDVQARNYITLR
jgi:hypothetical protein